MKLTKSNESDGKPRGIKDTIFSSTPVVLTVIATILAGLSSSEMTKSQYHRSMAAQNQSKASDQWSYYQAKRLRAVEAGNTLDILSATSRPAVADVSAIRKASTDALSAISASPGVLGVVEPLNYDLQAMLSDPGKLDVALAFPVALPKTGDSPVGDENITHAIEAADHGQTDAEMTPLLKQISEDSLTQAMKTADDNLTAFDTAIESANTTLEKLHTTLGQEAAIVAETQRQTHNLDDILNEIQAVQTDVSAARLRFAAARYNKEAGYNQISGQLLEVQVHRSGMESDRAKKRSSDFFIGMLAAQAGVVISTFAMAMQRRSTFWAMAAMAGMLALGFSSYVYLFI